MIEIITFDRNSLHGGMDRQQDVDFIINVVIVAVSKKSYLRL